MESFAARPQSVSVIINPSKNSDVYIECSRDYRFRALQVEILVKITDRFIPRNYSVLCININNIH